MANIETHKLKFPWSISEKEFRKFKDLNNFTSKYIDHHCIEVPVETSIDLSPLLPLLPIHISNSAPTFSKSIPELIKFNDHLNIETLNRSTINIKIMADIPTRQNGHLYSQLCTWTILNNLALPNDSSAKFHLIGTNIDGKFGPDVAYMPHEQHMTINIEERKNHTIPVPPSFVIENRSYSEGPINNRDYQMSKMVMWIECGVQSGILVDGKSRVADIYCRRNLLQPQIDQPGSFVHPQALLQLQQSQLELIELQNSIARLQQSLNFIPVDMEGRQDILDSVQDSIQRKQIKLNILISNNHLFFQNMTVVPGHPDVCHFSIPFWDQEQYQPQHGPNLIIHCVGDVNGFQLNLSSFPMV
ncbi:hypothetical protein DLAC_07617 [Tieghemostelium lacteum]|uniref:Putative restriction endonuclease domain-containing protein n=1 Tax=Tieghemostelium lacteum TaxID=361077 RepID=A0A151ZD12_TIELA|nr:hypothetical protein DLAC_07617 [Tieghemostelium lacteum]|eukprot:KYQ91821.1 hypothetical protein DLAC_07617 [Tieghemostelium lacteum]